MANQQQQQQSSSSSSSTLSIPQTAPAGGLTFTQPPQTASPSFYKIAPGQLVTFGWNFTALLSTPTHLTVSAFCPLNGNTYPVGPTDGVIPGNALSVVWDLYSYQQANSQTPLAQASYTLSIWDDRGPTAGISPGLFVPNENLRFALYTPQAYTPLASGWNCPDCSSASPNKVAGTVPIALITTSLILILSGWRLLRFAFSGVTHEER
ncbi:hypothetical protein SISNIDRAFT_437124 [Sistotremastrum niveocremeum HHB9708]|uniref:DUF7137 domain-containing protein n=2 Tax=Sistotremastraceae TaxID=3402574 RepID=A0A164YQ83_9AGAM|nr:hypothetical protein SISNIDRAFT_437124 [Sistotremastrum niveocremeum HHB9708]KZT41624.1 hypothetical protein SISSUDRAFT_1069797 [Sistotremastrum suecicum HHB10207 ss-3]